MKYRPLFAQELANSVTVALTPASRIEARQSGWFTTPLPNLGPLGSGVFRLAQVRRAGFTV